MSRDTDNAMQVNARYQLPINAIIASFVFTALISLINIGSTIAYNIINSVGIAALMFSYIISIGCILWRKLTNQPLLPTKFSMGTGFGIAVNIFAMCFLVVAFIFSFFPPYPVSSGMLSSVTMNWACLIFGVVIIWSVVYYLLYGRKAYVGPVEYVRKLQ